METQVNSSLNSFPSFAQFPAVLRVWSDIERLPVYGPHVAADQREGFSDLRGHRLLSK